MTNPLRIALPLFLISTSAIAHASIEEKLVSTIERQAADVAANAPDCDKIAEALMSHASEDRAVSREAAALDKGKSRAQKKEEQAALMVKYGARLQAAQRKLSAARECRGNAKLAAWKKASE